ncbi:hypothetical protein Ciccas_012274 [Cichlidogyrus casuarinus]|uniref:Uncharacterized protein n=1 Tax=Cichlidogyrus casuarinus TaxID=1844966 RepID=A0ABD2PNY2_9PLAT
MQKTEKLLELFNAITMALGFVLLGKVVPISLMNTISLFLVSAAFQFMFAMMINNRNDGDYDIYNILDSFSIGVPLGSLIKSRTRRNDMIAPVFVKPYKPELRAHTHTYFRSSSLNSYSSKLYKKRSALN